MTPCNLILIDVSKNHKRLQVLALAAQDLDLDLENTTMFQHFGKYAEDLNHQP
jgi:hypothetical protein